MNFREGAVSETFIVGYDRLPHTSSLPSSAYLVVSTLPDVRARANARGASYAFVVGRAYLAVVSLLI